MHPGDAGFVPEINGIKSAVKGPLEQLEQRSNYPRPPIGQRQRIVEKQIVCHSIVHDYSSVTKSIITINAYDTGLPSGNYHVMEPLDQCDLDSGYILGRVCPY